MTLILMVRNSIVLLVFALAALAAGPPNVVLIISDDHGWADYGFMKHPQVRTPHIDALAAESLLFTRGYVPTSLCRPSLASIMTGLYPHQHGITGNDPPGDAKDVQLRAQMTAVLRQHPTLMSRLQQQGYVAHQSGKWWEGECTCCGFTECMTHGDPARGGRHGDDGLKIGRETMQPIYDFLDQSKGKPFLLWYAPMMPHTPHNPPARLLAKYSSAPPAQARYYAMIEWFDETVGALVKAIDDRGLTNDTIFVYLADNGWVQLPGNQPLWATRAKMSPYDAGTRTPIFFRWKGHIAPRRDDATLVSSIDIAPTLLAALKLKPATSLPGLSVLEGKKLAARREVFGANFVHTSLDLKAPARNLKYRWIIQDHWKLVAPYEPNAKLPMWERFEHTGWSTAPQLYDLRADPEEKNDLAGANREMVTKLTQRLDRWWKP